jgi:hypothetical protein
MKRIIILFIILLALANVIILSTRQGHPLSRGEQLVNSTLAKTAKIIQDKYNLRPCGEGAAMPGGPIQGLALCFNTKYPHTKEQLRVLVIRSAHELLKQVNENEEMQEFLYERPFTIKNMEIIIYNHDKDGNEIYDPQISTAQILDGVLNFRTVDKKNTFRFKDQFDETYEEALKKIHE